MFIFKQLLVKIRCLALIWRKSRRVPLIFALFFVTSSCLLGWPRLLLQQPSADRVQAPQETVQVHDMLRFHVRAHSNSPRDQKIKNYVAQKVLAYYQPEWSRCRSSDELSLLLTENSTALEGVTRKILQAYGCPYDVHVSLVRDVFPARCYEGKLYPPGEYTALYLVIGEGRGENWWCVLFPPLCFSIVPSLAAEDEQGQGDNLFADGYAEKNSAIQVPAETNGKNRKEDRTEDKVDVVDQEKRPRGWRFWLWEVITKKWRQQEKER